MIVEFELNGQPHVALNGGPTYKLTPAFSMMVNCETQDEIDHYWEKLQEGGGEVACGWLVDKFGVSWQVTPVVLMEMQKDPDEQKRERVMQAMLKMIKLDIAELQRAYDGE
jgi:two-component system sensor histidine kinase QseC